MKDVIESLYKRTKKDRHKTPVQTTGTWEKSGDTYRGGSNSKRTSTLSREKVPPQILPYLRTLLIRPSPRLLQIPTLSLRPPIGTILRKLWMRYSFRREVV